jgi:hypothetical protein
MEYSLGNMEIQKVENTEYNVPKMGLPRPSKGKVVRIQENSMLYLNDERIEIGIPLRSNMPYSSLSKVPNSLSKMKTKIEKDKELLLIARYPGIELQYILGDRLLNPKSKTFPQYHFNSLPEKSQKGKALLIYERFPENLKSDSTRDGAHEYANLTVCCSGTANVVLPSIPLTGILNKRLTPHTKVKSDSLLVKEEMKYAKYENLYHNKTFPLPDSATLTPQEYYALIAQIHPIPYWDF